MVWLRYYAHPALSTQDTCCDAFRVVRQRWAQCERLELYEPRHACAALPNQLGHTDGGAPVQRLYGHPNDRGMRDRIRIALGSWEQKRSRRIETCL